MSGDLSARILAAIAETERVAREAESACWHVDYCDDRGEPFHDMHSPAATLIRCEADRELAREYVEAGKVYDADPSAFQSGYTAGLWCGLKRLATVYGVGVEAPAVS
jgi:hypothetical protein